MLCAAVIKLQFNSALVPRLSGLVTSANPLDRNQSITYAGGSMEFRCSKTDVNSAAVGNRSSRALALHFDNLTAEGAAAPTFVEKVTAFLEKYRTPAQQIPRARA